MRAARFYGARDVRIEEVPVPIPGPNQCLVEVAWCGICGTDLHEYAVGPLGYPRQSTLGHEFCGHISKAPAGSKLKVGQAVMIDPRILCGSCFACEQGDDQICRKLKLLGCSNSPGGGGLSEFVAVDEEMLHPLPENISPEYAAIIEPLAVAYHAVKATNLVNQDVLILGGGPIGLAVALVLQAENVNQVFLSEPTAARKARAQDLVTTVIDPINENVVDILKTSTGGRGVGVVFDCAGVPAGLETAFDAMAPGATYVNVAVWEKPLTIPSFKMFLSEIKMLATCCYSKADFGAVVELLGQGKYNGYEKMVTSRIALEDVVAKGFEELVNNKDNHIKIMISPKLSS